MKRILIILMVVFGCFFAMMPIATAASSNAQVFQSCSQVSGSPVCDQKNTTSNPVNHILKVATDIIALMTGIAAVIMIIISGLTMVTSSGNSEAVANARKRIIYAVVGLVIVSLAWAIITFLTGRIIKT